MPTFSERIELDDGDFIDINLSKKTSGDIVAVFHGLAGCVSSSYISGVFQNLDAAGFRPVLMHWRGCSGEPNRLSRSYHSGASDDVEWFVNYLSKRFPDQRVYALGYSLGANALLKYLGEKGSDTPVEAAMAVCPPLVLEECSRQLNSGFARIYQAHLLKRMRFQHENKRLAYPHLNLPPATASLDTFWKFDDVLTAPLHGYDSAQDYYNRCSARQFLPAIEIASHILCSGDDPFFTPAVLPTAGELGPDTTLEITKHGGHVAFLGRRSNNRRWLDSRIADVLSGFQTKSRSG